MLPFRYSRYGGPNAIGYNYKLVAQSQRREIWIVDAHRGHGQRFIVRADDVLSAIVDLEREVLTVPFYLESNHAD